MRRIAGQPPDDDEWPVLPKPPRGTPLVEPGRVVGVVVVVVVGVWVAVRVKAGRDQWLLLLVRDQPPLVPEERRGEHPSAPAAPGTAVDVAAGGLPAGPQSRVGTMAEAEAPTPVAPISSKATCEDRFTAHSPGHGGGAQHAGGNRGE